MVQGRKTNARTYPIDEKRRRKKQNARKNRKQTLRFTGFCLNFVKMGFFIALFFFHIKELAIFRNTKFKNHYNANFGLFWFKSVNL